MIVVPRDVLHQIAGMFVQRVVEQQSAAQMRIDLVSAKIF